MAQPKFKKGDLVHMHNEPDLVVIDYCWPSDEPGKSHRYSVKRGRTTLYGSGKGYYEQVFKKATKKEVTEWEAKQTKPASSPGSATSGH